jgi:hypothetical protein
MRMEKKDRKIGQLYLQLASECFNKAATIKDANAAEALRRMGRHYITEATGWGQFQADRSLTGDAFAAA